MRRALLYLRVSDPRQVHNLSLDTQEQICRDYCDREGMEVIEVFREEGESAKTRDRTELKHLLETCSERRGEIDVVVVYNLNRFARNKPDHYLLRAALQGVGVVLRSATEPIDESETGSLIEGVLASVHQFDNDLRTRRTIDGMKKALSMGRWPFKGPLGLPNSPKGSGLASLIQDPVRAPLIRQAFELIATGEMSKIEALRQVTALGLTTATGKPISSQHFTKILRNKIYAGWIILEDWDISVRGDFEPIVSEETFQRVQEVLDSRGLKKSHHTLDNPMFPLRRFIRCSWCDTPMTGNAPNGGPHRYYFCRNSACKGDGEKRVSVRTEDLERTFLDLVGSMVPRPELVSLFAEIVRDVWTKRHRAQAVRRDQLARRLDELRSARNALVDAHVHKRQLDADTFQEQMERNRSDEAQLKRQLAEAAQKVPEVESILPFAERVLRDPGALWEDSELPRRQRLQRYLFPEGLRFDGESFGIAVRSPVFETLGSLGARREEVVTPRGFEPLSPG